jgi:flagellar biosynthesis protein FliQ
MTDWALVFILTSVLVAALVVGMALGFIQAIRGKRT